MVALEKARRVIRIGRRIQIGGGLLGAVVWLLWFRGNYSMSIIFLLPPSVGLMILSAGRMQERSAQQSNVGRQCDNRFRITVQESCLAAEHWVGIRATSF